MVLGLLFALRVILGEERYVFCGRIIIILIKKSSPQSCDEDAVAEKFYPATARTKRELRR